MFITTVVTLLHATMLLSEHVALLSPCLNSSETILGVTLREVTQVVLSLSAFCMQGHPCGTEESTPLLPEEMEDFEDFSSSDDSDDYDSDTSYRSFSPVSSDDEYFTSSDSDSDGYSDDEEDSHVDGDDFQSSGKERLSTVLMKLDTLNVREYMFIECNNTTSVNYM